MVESFLQQSETELIEDTYFYFLLYMYVYPKLSKPVKRLDDFLEENRHLFTLISVFGAVSIYLRTVDEELDKTAKLVGEFALVTGFAIVILLSLVVTTKLLWKMREAKRGIRSFENTALILFTVPFAILMLVIGGMISNFPTVWAFYGFLLVYFGALFSSLLMLISFQKVVSLLNERLRVHETIIGAISFSLFSLVLLLSIGTIGVVEPESFKNVIDGGSIYQWFAVYSTTTALLLTLVSMGIAGMFLIGTFLGILLSLILLLKTGIKTLLRSRN